MRHAHGNPRALYPVSMEDLITDLLSQPVDVSEWLPPWVLEVRWNEPACFGCLGCVRAPSRLCLLATRRHLIQALDRRASACSLHVCPFFPLRSSRRSLASQCTRTQAWSRPPRPC